MTTTMTATLGNGLVFEPKQAADRSSWFRSGTPGERAKAEDFLRTRGLGPIWISPADLAVLGGEFGIELVPKIKTDRVPRIAPKATIALGLGSKKHGDQIIDRTGRRYRVVS